MSKECHRSLARHIAAKCGRHGYALEGKFFFSSEIMENFDSSWFNRNTFVPSGQIEKPKDKQRTLPSTSSPSPNLMGMGQPVTLQAEIHSVPTYEKSSSNLGRVADPVQLNLDTITVLQDPSFVS